MIKQNSVGTKHSVGFAEIGGQMEAGHLADAIRTARMERRAFLLGSLADVAEHFARTGEIKLAARLQLAQRRQHVMGAVDVGGHGGESIDKTLPNKALGRQMIALVELLFGQYAED